MSKYLTIVGCNLALTVSVYGASAPPRAHATDRPSIVFSAWELVMIRACDKLLVDAPSSDVSSKPALTVNDFVWNGRAPHPLFLANYLEDGKHLEKGDIATPIDFDQFKEMFKRYTTSTNARLYFDDTKAFLNPVGRMLVERNGVYEEAMIQSSLMNKGREVMGVKMTNVEGVETEIPICEQLTCGHVDEHRFWVGAARGVFMPIDKIAALMTTLSSQGIQIDLVEVAHTHPVIQFRRESRPNPDGTRLRIIYPFNYVDLSQVKKLSSLHPQIKIRGKAVTPDGYSYSVTLLNGKTIEE